eukprot:403367701
MQRKIVFQPQDLQASSDETTIPKRSKKSQHVSFDVDAKTNSSEFSLQQSIEKLIELTVKGQEVMQGQMAEMLVMQRAIHQKVVLKGQKFQAPTIITQSTNQPMIKSSVNKVKNQLALNEPPGHLSTITGNSAYGAFAATNTKQNQLK